MKQTDLKCPACKLTLKKASKKALPFTNPKLDYVLHAHIYRCPMCGYMTITKGRRIKKVK